MLSVSKQFDHHAAALRLFNYHVCYIKKQYILLGCIAFQSWQYKALHLSRIIGEQFLSILLSCNLLFHFPTNIVYFPIYLSRCIQKHQILSTKMTTLGEGWIIYKNQVWYPFRPYKIKQQNTSIMLERLWTQEASTNQNIKEYQIAH